MPGWFLSQPSTAAESLSVWQSISMFSLAANANAGSPSATNTAATTKTDIRELRGPAQGDTPPLFILTAGVLILVSAALLMGHRSRRRLRRPDAERTTPSVRPEPNARLAELVDEFRGGSSTGHQLIVRMDEILRDALVEWKGISATHLTSAELMQNIGTTPGGTWRSLLADLLPFVDQVKFAHYNPNTAEVDRALGAAANILAALGSERTA
jgi:hypothetical protein